MIKKLPWLRTRSGTTQKAPEAVPTFTRPVMALYGWLPGVNKQDALSYARGLAVSNGANQDNLLVFVAEYDGGWAFEIQEGGAGKPYLPSIITRMLSTEERISLFVSTSTRTVQIDKDARGLSSVWLPESRDEPTSEGVRPDPLALMWRAVPDAAAWLKIGLIVLFSGVFSAAVPVLAFSVALPLLFADGAEQVGQMPAVPIDQWSNVMEAAGKGLQVKALEYQGGRWELKTAGLARAEVPVETPVAPLAPPAVLNPGTRPPAPVPPTAQPAKGATR